VEDIGLSTGVGEINGALVRRDVVCLDFGGLLCFAVNHGDYRELLLWF